MVMKEDNLNKLGFEGDPHVLPVIKELVKKHHVSAIIETGTFYGNSTAKFAELKLPVKTIESQPAQFKAAYDNLKAKGFDVDAWDKGTIHMIQAHSHNCLNEVIESTKAKNIFFYLDAHWESHLPLLDELKHIAASKVSAVIAIHDFYVPNSEFGFDTYHGQKLDFEFIEPYLDAIYPKGYNYFYNTVAEGHKRGLIFIEPKELAPDGTEFIPFEGSEAEAKVKAYQERFPADDEQVTESIEQLRVQVANINKEYMALPVGSNEANFAKAKLKEVTDKLRKLESEVGTMHIDKPINEPSPAPKKRGRPSKKKK